MSWKEALNEQWQQEVSQEIATQLPAVEIRYGKHHIKIYSKGFMTGAPAGMELTFSGIPLGTGGRLLLGRKRGRLNRS